jgi:MarR family 2-MHQ and catechol resistance regulon transcriptional repressor
MGEKRIADSARAAKAYFSLIDAAHTLEAFLARPLAPAKLTLGQFRVLETLLRSGAQAQGTLVDLHFRSEGTGSSTLAGLERRGLIVRRDLEGDGRKWKVHLTPEGQALAAKVLPRHTNLVRAKMAALNGREQNVLWKLCDKLTVGNPMRFISELTLVDGEDFGEGME